MQNAKLKPLLLLFLLLGFTWIQENLCAIPWLQTYPWQNVCHYSYHQSYITAYNVIPALGGGYVLDAQAGFSFSDPDFPSYYSYRILWKLAENGTAEFRRAAEGFNHGYQTLVSDGQSCYYGIWQENANTHLDLFDAELSLINSYSFVAQNGLSARLNDLIWTAQGLLLCGSVDGQSKLIMTDHQFNLLWQGDSLGSSPNGIFACLPYQEGWLGISSDRLACFSAVGDTLWTHNSQPMYLVDLLVTDTNRIIVIAADQTNSNSYSQLSLLEYLPANNELNFLTNTGMSGYNPQYYNPISLIENVNGDLLVFGRCGAEQYRILNCYGPDGTYLWSRSFFDAAEGIPGKGKNNIFATNAGDLVFCMGFDPIDFNNPEGIAVAKASYLGEITSVEDQALIPSTATICHYPNPAVNSLSFGFELKGNLDKPELQIYNLKGQLLWTKELKGLSGTLSLNLNDKPFNDLSNGIYLYRLCNGKIALQTGKFTLLK